MSRWGTGPARLAAALAAIGLAACAPATPIPRGDNAVCAGLFDQLEQMEHTPFSGGPGYDFLSAQLARIRQADCITFTNDLSGMEATGTALLPHVPPTGPQLQPSVAVQAGVVTNPTDAGRAIAFFEALGYRARAQGAPRLGTRIYVQARTPAQIEDIVALAGKAGLIGAYPSRYVRF